MGACLRHGLVPCSEQQLEHAAVIAGGASSSSAAAGAGVKCCEIGTTNPEEIMKVPQAKRSANIFQLTVFVLAPSTHYGTDGA